MGDAAEPGWSSHLQSGALHVFIFFMTDFLLGMNHFSVVWPTERNQRSSFFFLLKGRMPFNISTALADSCLEYKLLS